MSLSEDLDAMGASPSIRAALALLPRPFAEAVASDALRCIWAESVPVKPVDPAETPEVAHLPPAPGQGPGWWIQYRRRNGGLASPALMRWRCVDALTRGNVGALRAMCGGFRIVLAAHEAANGTPLTPDCAECPPVAIAPFALS